MKTIRKIRAISPLIATIILIAITIVGGLLIYNLFFATSSTASSTSAISVQNIDLVVPGGSGNAQFSITVKNTGNKPIKNYTITIIGENGQNSTSRNLSTQIQPGQTFSVQYTPVNATNKALLTFVVGKYYAVNIQVTFSDGTTFATSTSVQARAA
jgi:flagellin-like protein